MAPRRPPRWLPSRSASSRKDLSAATRRKHRKRNGFAPKCSRRSMFVVAGTACSVAGNAGGGSDPRFARRHSASPPLGGRSPGEHARADTPQAVVCSLSVHRSPEPADRVDGAVDGRPPADAIDHTSCDGARRRPGCPRLLGGCAALDPACAPSRLALIDSVNGRLGPGESGRQEAVDCIALDSRLGREGIGVGLRWAHARLRQPRVGRGSKMAR